MSTKKINDRIQPVGKKLEEIISSYTESRKKFGFSVMDSSIIPGSILDLVNHERKAAVHFVPSSSESPKNRDSLIRMSLEAFGFGYSICHVIETDWYYNPYAVLKRIDAYLGVFDSEKAVNARQCTIKRVSRNEYFRCRFGTGPCSANENYIVIYDPQGRAVAGAAYRPAINGREHLEIRDFWTDSRRVTGTFRKIVGYLTGNDRALPVTFRVDLRWWKLNSNLLPEIGFKPMVSNGPSVYAFQRPSWKLIPIDRQKDRIHLPEGGPPLYTMDAGNILMSRK